MGRPALPYLVSPPSGDVTTSIALTDSRIRTLLELAPLLEIGAVAVVDEVFDEDLGVENDEFFAMAEDTEVVKSCVQNGGERRGFKRGRRRPLDRGIIGSRPSFRGLVRGDKHCISKIEMGLFPPN